MAADDARAGQTTVAGGFVVFAPLKAQIRRIPVEVWVLVGWIATRLPLYLTDSGHLPDHWHDTQIGDTEGYGRWAEGLHAGHFPPSSDVYWQYPPGVAWVMLVPRHVASLMDVSYAIAFMRCMLLADLVVTVLLVVLARRARRWAGVGFWLLAIPLIGPLVLARFDLLTAVAVAAFFVSRSPFVAGLFGGAGAAVKIWPAMLALGVAGDRRRQMRSALGFAVGAAVVSIVPMMFMSGGTGFLHAEKSRGLEIESVAAFPFLIWEHGHPGYGSAVSFGSVEVYGPGTSFVASHLIWVTVVAFAALAALVWRFRERRRAAWAAEIPLVAVLILIVTSRVISPQYMIWVAVLMAVCLTYRDHRQRRAAQCLAVVFALTVLEFPIGFDDLIAFNAGGTEIVSLRNAALIAALAIAWHGLLARDKSGEPVGDAGNTESREVLAGDLAAAAG